MKEKINFHTNVNNALRDLKGFHASMNKRYIYGPVKPHFGQ